MGEFYSVTYKFPDCSKFSIICLHGFCNHKNKNKKLISHLGSQTWRSFPVLVAIAAGQKWTPGLLFSHQTVVHSIELQATDGHDRPLTDCTVTNSGRIDVKTPFVVEVADWWPAGGKQAQHALAGQCTHVFWFIKVTVLLRFLTFFCFPPQITGTL